MKPLLITLALIGLASAASAERFPATEKFSQTYPLAATGSVRLFNINGTVDIIAWDRNEVALEAEKRASNSDQLARIHIDIDAQTDRLVIKTEHEKTGWFGSYVRGEVHYQLKVPACVVLKKVEVINARINVRGVRGPINLETVNGDISATGLASNTWIETVNGRIAASFAATVPGQVISIETVNGVCELTLPKDARAHLDLSSLIGRTRCTFPLTLEKTGLHSLRGMIGASTGATIKVQTLNGGISVGSG